MPDIRFEAITVLVVLLPGFFAARIEQRLTVNPKQNEFDKIVEALLYSFFIYLIFTVIFHAFPISLTAEQAGETVHYSIEASPLRLALLPVIALALSVLVSFAANNDYFGRLFRLLRVSRRTWRSSTWGDVFHNFGGVVQVELSDGRCVMGWLKYFSDRPEDRSVFLERAAWVTAGGDLEEIKGAGIFLTQKSGIRSVMFLNASTEQDSSPNSPSVPAASPSETARQKS
jgi:Family of unknown function (DUF6338)